MKKSRIFIVLGVILLLVLGGGLLWFWSLGSLPEVSDPELKLAINEGSVFISKGGAPEESARSGMDLEAGDRLRTGENSAASVLAYGKADVRLDENTEIVIEDANGEGGFGFAFKLEAGKSWSRLLHLLDLNSFFEARTDSVVATVRGTAFSTEKIGDEVVVYVDHAGVHVQSDYDSDYLAPEDWARFDSGRMMASGGSASNSRQLDEWMRVNRQADGKFMDAAGKRMADSLQASSGPAPDSWSYDLSLSSEKLHLMFAGDRKAETQARYIARRLGYVRDLMERGKSGLALHELAAVEDEIKGYLHDHVKEEERDNLRSKVGLFLLSFSNVMPESSMYRVKLRIEDMYVAMWEESSEQSVFARVLSGDDRLEEAERFDCTPNVAEQLEKALQAVEQTLIREEGDFERWEGGFSDNGRQVIAEKIAMQRKRQEVLLEKLEMCKEPRMPELNESMTATSTTSTLEIATSTEAAEEPQVEPEEPDVTPEEPVIEPPVEEPPVEEPPIEEPPVEEPPVEEPPTQPETLGLSRIELYAQPNPAFQGDYVKLYVKGIKTDGSELDVTSKASFTLIGNIGSLQGATYHASTAGSVRIIAEVVDAGVTHTAEVSLMIKKGPVVLESLELLSNGSSQIYQGENRALTAIAHYSDGQSKTVTNLATYSVSDKVLGYMSGSIFYSRTETTGWVIVSASYTEDGTTRSTELSLEVVSDNYVTN